MCQHSRSEDGCSVSARSPSGPSRPSTCSTSERVSYSLQRCPSRRSGVRRVCGICRRTQAVNVWLVFTTPASINCVYVLLTFTTDCFSLHTLQFHLLIFFTCVERRTKSSQSLIRFTFSRQDNLCLKDIIIYNFVYHLYLVNLKSLAREAT